MLEYKQFSNLNGKVSQLLQELNFKPERIFCDEDGECKFHLDNKSGTEEGHHYYLAEAPTKDGKKVVIKIQLDYPNEPNHIFIGHKSFLKEQEFYKHSAQLLGFVPNYISSGKFEDLNWLIYEFVPGETLGLAHTTGTAVTAEQVTRLIEILGELSGTEIPAKTQLDVKNGAYFTEHLQEFFKVHSKALSPIVSSEQRQKLDSLNNKFSAILDRQPHCLVHGDLHPGNVILGSDKTSVTIIDWEQVHLGTPVLDIAKLWNRAWQSPWRNQFLAAARQHTPAHSFDDQFRYLTLHLLLDELVFWSWLAKNKTSSPLGASAEQALASQQKTFIEALTAEDFVLSKVSDPSPAINTH